MGTNQRANLLQRAEVIFDKTEEDHSQEEHHSAENVNAKRTLEEINIPSDVATRQIKG